MNIVELPLHLVDGSDRLREIDVDKAAMIAASMRETGGQLTPIEVRQPDPATGIHRLIAGGHRLRAIQINAVEHGGRPMVLAHVSEVTDDDALLREVDENLIRADLTPLDRATFLAERRRLYLKKHPETAHGKNRKKESGNDCHLIAVRFTAATAERVGLSERTIRLACTLYEKLHPSVRKRLSGTVFAERQDQLLLLADEPHDVQLDILELLVGGNKRAPSVKAAIEELDGVAGQSAGKTADDKHYESFTALWGRCSDATKENIRSFLSQQERRSKRSSTEQRRRPDSAQ